MTRALIYMPQAQDDLDDLLDFIAVNNSRRARTYIDEIRQACRGLYLTVSEPTARRERVMIVGDRTAGLSARISAGP